ncbi:hypothetical protein [Halpernia sp.]|uniref:hypothetical protein n=1 Tax=Halpernia sp. TaxID=2782209 RepID=UPI003A9380D3
MNANFKTKISLILLILIAQFSFAQVFTQNYATGVNKTKALENAKFFEDDIAKYDYSLSKTYINQPSEYDVTWSKKDKTDGVLKVKMNYKFSDSGVRVEIVNANYYANNKEIAIIQNSSLAAVKNVYDANKSLFVDVFLQYLNLTE